MKVAIIGAGISGAVCARTLVDHGVKVEVFEKSRGPGGRMSTRRAHDAHWYDHGAQYFTVDHPVFEKYVSEWLKADVIAEWKARFLEINEESRVPLPDKKRFVGVPSMTAAAKMMLRDVVVHEQNKIDHLKQLHEQFTHIVIATPAKQAWNLVETISPNLAKTCSKASFHPCWALMVGFSHRLDLDFDAAKIHNSPICWIANNATKPGRQHLKSSWTVHASPDWSTQNLEKDASTVERELLEIFKELIKLDSLSPTHLSAHRWRYAMTDKVPESSSFYDQEKRLGVCGDWTHGNKVQDAFLSGMTIAQTLLKEIHKI